MIDKSEAKFQYFNNKHKKVLPESSLTQDPIIYQCDVLSSLPICSNAGASSQCSDGTNLVNYCVYDGELYKYVTSPVKCEKITYKKGELFNCVRIANKLPDCENDAGIDSCVTGAVKDSFCLDNNVLRKTTANGCEAFVHDTKTYYFDKKFKIIKKIDNNTSVYTRITCTSGSNCIINGKKVAGQLVRTPTSVELCLDAVKHDSISLLETKQLYKGITVATSGNFAGTSSTGAIKVKTTGKSIVKVDSTDSTVKICKNGIAVNDPKCQDNSGTPEDVDLCITYRNIIYKQEGKCQILKASTAKSTTINYFNSVYKTPSSIDGLEHRYAYRCKFNGGSDHKEASECIPMIGYSISGSNLVSCSGLNNDDCDVTAHTSGLATCGSTEDGKIGKDGSNRVVCVGGKSIRNISSTVTDSPVYVAYKSTTDNMIYGTGSGTFNLLEVGPNYALKAKYINGNYKLGKK